MNYYNPPPRLIGSRTDETQPLKLCSSCDKECVPGGGIEMRGKWHCASCWTKFARARARS